MIVLKSLRNNIVHEMGHAFNNNHSSVPVTSLPPNYKTDRTYFLHNNEDPGIMWQAHKVATDSETFADMFVAYTYDVWGDWSNPNNQRELRRHNPDESNLEFASMDGRSYERLVELISKGNENYETTKTASLVVF